MIDMRDMGTHPLPPAFARLWRLGTSEHMRVPHKLGSFSPYLWLESIVVRSPSSVFMPEQHLYQNLIVVVGPVGRFLAVFIAIRHGEMCRLSRPPARRRGYEWQKWGRGRGV